MGGTQSNSKQANNKKKSSTVKLPRRRKEKKQQKLLNPHQEWSLLEDKLDKIQAPTTNTGEELDIDLDKCLEFSVTLGSEKVKALSKEQNLSLLTNIKEANFDKLEIEIDSKIDLVCVIDISGSMSGEKIENVKATMRNLLEVLSDGHRLAIVLFNQEAFEYMNFKILNEENKGKILDVVNSIPIQGGTNIITGVKSSQLMLGKRETRNHVSTIFFLSDGKHNSFFLNDEINIDKLYNGELERAKCEYTLTCFGYGDDHDANLLQQMSEAKGGNYYFVNDVSKIEECFLDCLGMVTSVLGQNIVIDFKLKPSKIIPEIRFHKTFGPYWDTLSPINSQIKIKSFYSGFNKNFMAQIKMNPIKQGTITEETEIIIGEVLFEIESIEEIPKKKILSQTLKLRLIPEESSEDIKENEDVQKQLTRVIGADVIDSAQKLNENRNFEEAIAIIDSFIGDLENRSYNTELLFVNMNENMKKQKKMIENNRDGIENEFKTENFAKQTRNIYMNECSAPMFSKGLYQNKKQRKNIGKY